MAQAENAKKLDYTPVTYDDQYILMVNQLKKYFPIKGGLMSQTVGHVKAVDGVTFNLKRGHTMGLVGESGCGKSTTGRTILRLAGEKTGGQVLFNGKEVYDMTGRELRNLRTKMQIIFQDPFSSLSPRLPVGEIIGEAVREQLAVSARRTTDYRAFLRRFSALREETPIDADSFDYGYYAYGLRHFGNMPLIEPLETREVRKIEDFVIAIDTSMSTSGELVRAFLSRTYELLQENTSFFRHFNLRILQCDDQLRSDKEVTNARELAEYMEHFELIGQSATDFRPVFEHVDRLNAEGAFRHLRGLLYFTDGLGIYPKKRPKYDAAFVMLEGEAYPDKVPSWGIRAVISEDALAVE